MAEKESFIEKVLRSVLISSKGGVPLQKLNYEFKDLLGEEIPFRENGFRNLEAYLKTMPTVCQIKRDPSTGETVCMGVANEETKHLDRLVKKQKAAKKKSKPARVPRYSGRPNNRPRRPPPAQSRNKPSYQSQQQYPSKKSTNYSQGRSGSEVYNGPQNRGSHITPEPRNTGPYHSSYQRKDPPKRNEVQRNWPDQSSDVRNHNKESSHRVSQRNHPSEIDKSWREKPASNNQRQNQGVKNQPKVQQHSSTYEVPPRFRRQFYSTSSNDDHQETQSYENTKSDKDYSVPEETMNNNKFSKEEPVEIFHKETSQQPPQPPPVDDKIVSWVNETLADKSGGLWLSGLKKLYKEKFEATLEDDLIYKLSRLSLWTAEEIGFQSDAILYPNMRLGDTKALSTDSLHAKGRDKSQQFSTSSVVGNDQILYPNLKVEVSQTQKPGKERRNVSNSPPRVPDIVIPEEDCLWEVYVSYIISVVDFYCVIMGDDYADKLCTLEDDMRELYEMDDGSLQLRDLPEVGSLYAAQMSDDWLRVKVIAVDNQEAGCFLVDHGDVESVPLDDLRILDPVFYDLAFQAIPCKLHGMDNKATSKTATSRFCNIALGQTRLAQVISKESKRLSLTLYRDRLNINYLCALGEVA